MQMPGLLEMEISTLLFVYMFDRASIVTANLKVNFGKESELKIIFMVSFLVTMTPWLTVCSIIGT